ncbi:MULTISPECIES: hypothetical protein [Streptomyces]|nr:MULTISPECIES: hypothetical protein [Streptomyces]AVH99234.1 hypothetical protein C5L38_32760 [Streptomyces sp. WAC00288]KYG50874.1 hypothetical protein AWI43_33860 [Streptomyces sp. WAC04657]MBY8816583.1 hypothetical protein [Streptomyces cinereoruber]PVC69471.1 hypothetical protein DBP18_21585 [Streptomyces sp. CS081A]QEV31057.1 hypothetical protein CP977_01805 [Streptomyces cinereoruber]
MRMLLKVQMDTQMSNEAIRQGTLEETLGKAMSAIRPEAAYFTTENGCRTAYVFFDLAESADMPKTAEPFFLELGAKVSYTPVMNREDLAKGLGAMETAG